MNRFLWARYKAIAAKAAKHIVEYVFSSGEVIAHMRSMANARSRPAGDSAGRLNAEIQSIANAITMSVGEVLLQSTPKMDMRGSGQSQEVEDVQMVMNTIVRSIAAGIVYGIVFGRGAVYANFNTKAGGRSAKAIPGYGELFAAFFTEAAARSAAAVRGGGYFTAESYGQATPTEEEVQNALMEVTAYVTGNAGATAQEPESVTFGSITQFIGNAGANTENIVYAGGQLISRVIMSAGGAIPTDSDGYQPYVLLTAADGDDGTEYTVMLYVDSKDHPIENASDPESTGEGEYIIQIN